jgi:glutathione-specific gamma-glutamylcyclotransferase
VYAEPVSDRWIFGYGSLVWRPAFEHAEREPGYVRGFARRFWQESTDHRGTPQAPGRVVTLLEEAGAICWGMAYRVGGDDLPRVLDELDYREKQGYRRVQTSVYLRSARAVAALVYVATPDNPHFLGPTPLADIAAVVRRSRGPSGHNVEYVLELARALEKLGVTDPHVHGLAALIAEQEG